MSGHSTECYEVTHYLQGVLLDDSTDHSDLLVMTFPCETACNFHPILCPSCVARETFLSWLPVHGGI